MLAIMAVAFLRFYRKRGEEVDDSDEYGKALSSRSSRYPLETFDLQALYRSVIVDSADSEQTSKRGSGHSVSAVATSSGRPSLPPLRSTSRTRSTISPAESPDNEDTQNWTDSELAPGSTASVSASYYEDEDRVYYHGGEAYTVTERVLRTSGKSSSQSTLPSRTEDKRRARRSSRKDLLFEPVGTEIGICNTNMNDDETEPLVNSTAKDNTTFRPNGTNEADHGPTTTSLSRRSDSSSCDTVPEPAPIVRSSAKSVPEYDQCNVDDAVYVSSRASMK